MLTRDDPEGGDEEEYRAVGDRAPVVAGARFAPEGVGDRLRFGTAGEVPRAVPKRRGRHREPEEARDAVGGHLVHDAAQKPDEEGGDPARQGAVLGHPLAADVGEHPVGRRAVQCVDGDPEGRRVADRPEVADPKARRDEEHQEHEERVARQLSGGLLRHLGWRRTLLQHGRILANGGNERGLFRHPAT